MNKFENKFFSKYIAEGDEIKGIIHIHFIEIFHKIFLILILGVLLPSFIYFYSDRIKELIPFIFMEGFLIFMFVKIIYDVFDWYNDVWILTSSGVLQLERALFKTNTVSVDYDKIEGIEIEQNNVLDKILKKGDLIIHKFGDDTLILPNAIKPYESADLIEEASSEFDSDNLPDEKFDVIMDALGGVVENYLDKKMTKTEKEQEIEKVIKKIENSEGTIDLR